MPTEMHVDLFHPLDSANLICTKNCYTNNYELSNNYYGNNETL